MSAHSDLLDIFAEIFIAFAGFAGVVAAFSTIRLSPEATVFRVRALVTVALVALVVSLLPHLPEAFGASEVAALRISAFVAGVGISILAVWIWRHLSPLYAAGMLDTQIFAALEYIAAALIVVGLFAVAAGRLVELGPAIYLSSLYLGIVLCSYYFVMFILAVDMGAVDERPNSLR